MELEQLRNSDKTIDVFFALVRAGLWEKSVRLLPFGDIDFDAILELAEEQSVVGLVAAGLEHIEDMKPTKKDVLQFIGRVTQLEQRNQAMNYFIGVIVEKMREAGIFTVLVKGQGVAQCYERPLWRSCGDVDLLLDDENYEKARLFLTPLASNIDAEDERKKHLGMMIDPWLVELHGTMHSIQLPKMNKGVDEAQRSTFYDGQARVWKNGHTDVMLPSADNDVIFIFCHILQHYFAGGIGIRQICDLCRLLWTYHKSIDINLLGDRLSRMGLMTEWKAFMAFCVKFLGLPEEAALLYSPAFKWQRKAKRICSFILETGNFGHRRDTEYVSKSPYMIRKLISFWTHTKDGLWHFLVFPADSLRVWSNLVINGLHWISKGK